MDARQKQKETFEFSKENGYMWTGRCSLYEKEESIVFLLTFKAFK